MQTRFAFFYFLFSTDDIQIIHPDGFDLLIGKFDFVVSGCAVQANHHTTLNCKYVMFSNYLSFNHPPPPPFHITVHSNATNKNQPNLIYGNSLAAGCRGGNCSIIREGKFECANMLNNAFLLHSFHFSLVRLHRAGEIEQIAVLIHVLFLTDNFPPCHLSLHQIHRLWLAWKIASN